MAEHHNNVAPALNGTISIHRMGVMNYFPIEQQDGLKPFYALFIHEKTDGSVSASIDVQCQRLPSAVTPGLFDE